MNWIDTGVRTANDGRQFRICQRTAANPHNTLAVEPHQTCEFNHYATREECEAARKQGQVCVYESGFPDGSPHWEQARFDPWGRLKLGLGAGALVGYLSGGLLGAALGAGIGFVATRQLAGGAGLTLDEFQKLPRA